MTNPLQTVKYAGEAIEGLEDQPVEGIAETQLPTEVDGDFISSESSDSDSEDGNVDSGLNSQGQAKKGTARSRKTPKKQTPKKQSNKNTPQPSPSKRSTPRKPQTPQKAVTPRKPRTPRSTKTPTQVQSQSQRRGRAAGPGNRSTAKSAGAKEPTTTPTKIKGQGEAKSSQPEEGNQGEDVEEGSQDEPQAADTETSSLQPLPSPQASTDQDLSTQMLGQDEGNLSSNRNSPDPTVTLHDNSSKHSSLTPLSRTPSPVMEVSSTNTGTSGNTAPLTEQ